jgi:putative ABC transport system ATP-binding protein
MEPGSDVSVRLRGVTKTYGKGESRVPALRGIDLDVRAGELLMLVGPSGCGKTTLISVASGILDHDEGQCLLLGEDLEAMADRRRVRFRGENVGFVFQAFNLIPALSALENAAVPLFIQGVPRREALRRASELLDRVGLSDRARAFPAELSGGQAQRVAIARALVHRPRLIVCDEPTSALDHETGLRVMEILREVALADGRSLILVTHDPRIFRFADRIAQMDDGRIVKVASSPSELN